MADEKPFIPQKPASNFLWPKEVDGTCDFEDKESNLGIWAGTTKKGDYFLKIRCLCGRKGLGFINTREGWKLVKGDSEPKEEW